jgi:uroporphyrinogen decarboxylase
MQKRERLEQVLSGERADRAPVALWRHWPGDDQRAADFARYTVGFQRAYDWDFIKVTPFSAYMVADYGVQTAWQGMLSGDRTIIKRAVHRSLEWTELRTLEPMRGEFGKHLEALRLMADALGQDADLPPVITTLYSPLSQAAQVAGLDTLLRHMRTEPDRLHTGLNTLTESTLRLITELRRLGLAGIYYVMDMANFDCISAEEYAIFGTPYDLKIWDTLPDKWWLNIAHLTGQAPMFDGAVQTQAPILHVDISQADLSKVRGVFDGVLCGGTTREQLHMDSPTIAKDSARRILMNMDYRRTILSAETTVYVSTPRANLRVLRELVEG